MVKGRAAREMASTNLLLTCSLETFVRKVKVGKTNMAGGKTPQLSLFFIAPCKPRPQLTAIHFSRNLHIWEEEQEISLCVPGSRHKFLGMFSCILLTIAWKHTVLPTKTRYCFISFTFQVFKIHSFSIF